MRPQNSKRKMHRGLRLHDFDGMDGLLIKDCAYILRRPYWETYFAIRKLGIRHRFPDKSEAYRIGRWGSGYAMPDGRGM